MNETGKADLVEKVCEDLWREIFREEAENLQKREDIFCLEKIERSKNHISLSEWKNIAEEFLANVIISLSKYHGDPLLGLIDSNIDDAFHEICEQEENKELINLIIAKKLWDLGNKDKLDKLYKELWYNPRVNLCYPRTAAAL
jgi:hypothetical protein